MLRRIFGLKRDEVTAEWRKLHNEEFDDLYSTSNIARMIKSRRMRGVGPDHVWGAYTEFWWRNPKERHHLENPGIDGWIILKWIFRKCTRILGHGLDQAVSE
jgi:hypothetical protein